MSLYTQTENYGTQESLVASYLSSKVS